MNHISAGKPPVSGGLLVQFARVAKSLPGPLQSLDSGFSCDREFFGIGKRGEVMVTKPVTPAALSLSVNKRSGLAGSDAPRVIALTKF